jgi:hypothetical protein
LTVCDGCAESVRVASVVVLRDEPFSHNRP